MSEHWAFHTLNNGNSNVKEFERTVLVTDIYII